MRFVDVCVRSSVVILSAFAFGCGSRATSDSPRSDSQSAEIAAQRLLLATERERLLQQQLELERQRSALERNQRKEAERQGRQHKDAELATQFTPDAIAELRQHLAGSASHLGRVLLLGTHPTGDYQSTDPPLVVPATDRKTVTVRVTVHWKGGFTETDYTTDYSIRLTPRGVDRLEVARDMALFPASPEFIKNTELKLREIFDSK